MRQLAWLSATPKPAAAKSPAGKPAKAAPEPDPQTRIQAMTASGIVPDLPFIRTPWIIDTLMEIGPSEAGAMGVVPLSWASIDHWQRCIGAELAPWTCRLIRRLSAEFVTEGQRAREPDCPPPWTAADDNNRSTISRKVSHAFRALITAKEDCP